MHSLIFQGMSLLPALQAAADRQSHPQIRKWLQDAVDKAAEAKDTRSSLYINFSKGPSVLLDDAAVTSIGKRWQSEPRTMPMRIFKAMPTEGALRSALYFALKYETDLEAALIANANVGGDSAARGMVIGMLLGAVPANARALPSSHRWVKGLNALPKVQALMDKLADAAAAAAKAESAVRSEL